MQCLHLNLKRHFGFGSAYIVKKTDVKRLMEVTHEMNEVIQRKLFLG